MLLAVLQPGWAHLALASAHSRPHRDASPRPCERVMGLGLLSHVQRLMSLMPPLVVLGAGWEGSGTLGKGQANPR